METKNEANSKHCLNCDHPLGTEDNYCSNCSQKNTDGRISVWDLLKEFFSDVLNIDSKAFRTAGALIVPGKLTTEFFKGKHKSYSSPLRTFFISGIILFALTNFFIDQAMEGDQDSLQGIQKNYYEGKIYKELDTLSQEFKKLESNVVADRTLDSLLTRLKGPGYEYRDTMRIDDIIFMDEDSIEGISIPKLAISYEDFLFKSPSDIVEKYMPEKGFIVKVLAKQTIKVQRSGAQMLHYLIGNIPLALLLMMPFLALILKILYVRRSQYYIEHLVFTFHFHTFVFVWVIMLALIGKYFPPLLLGLSIFYIFVYFYLALKKYYGQSWFKTFIKFWIIIFSYVTLAGIFMVLAALISFVLF